MAQDSPFLTPAQVAERYGTTAETVRRWAKEGKFPEGTAVRMPSGHVKYRRAVIDELMPEPEQISA